MQVFIPVGRAVQLMLSMKGAPAAGFMRRSELGLPLVANLCTL